MTNLPSPNNTLLDVYSWKTSLSLEEGLRYSILPIDVTKDQIIQLYFLAYPFIASEFVHRSDLETWANMLKLELNMQLMKINNALQTLQNHSHPDAAPAVLTFQTIDNVETRPQDFTFGENIVTQASEYSQMIMHRNPVAEPVGYVPQVSVVRSLKMAKQYIPFDPVSEGINTGDNGYIRTIA